MKTSLLAYLDLRKGFIITVTGLSHNAACRATLALIAEPKSPWDGLLQDLDIRAIGHDDAATDAASQWTGSLHTSYTACKRDIAMPSFIAGIISMGAYTKQSLHWNLLSLVVTNLFSKHEIYQICILFPFIIKFSNWYGAGSSDLG